MNDSQFEFLFNATVLAKSTIGRSDKMYAIVQGAGEGCGFLRDRDMQALYTKY